ncbi:ABC transporter ATP-binding protein [Galbitalea soli]|uniref:ABC transporter ATP-binding protein n=1 Tax=Galbitalea soli TaxID=1268042 RepID=A0A7C9TRX0_9MICO|nr:ABC transporter ATP-binding protein [Galbitalea soli]NEM92035.1 ABC transporter ATP-binding protein [Galbitalea soli]NYJ32013.1 ABC-2 type transport system ATP-binding protein [Galbitalea soli]
MLIAHHLTKSFGAQTVLRDVSFEVHPGRMTALLGPNGAGKSTLLHIVTGLLRQDSGVVLVETQGGLVADFRDLIGFCPDDLPQAELLTGDELLDLTAGIRHRRRAPEAERALVEALHLDGAMDRLIGTYSHGMKRKLQLVTALLHSPRILILDEPFRGLDPESSAILKALLAVYAERGNAVLISTHDLLVAEQLCTEVLVLRDGELLDLSPGQESTAVGVPPETLEARFLRATGIDADAARARDRFFEGLDLLRDARP